MKSDPSSSIQRKARRRRSFRVLSLSLTGLALAACAVWGYQATTAHDAIAETPAIPQGTVAAFRGPLSLVLDAKGPLECSRKSTLVSKVEWPTKLTYVAPEGSMVKKGDVVAELDVSKLTEEYGEEKVDVLTAETNFETARQNLRIQEIENRSLLATANLTRDLTALAVEAYKKGEYPLQVEALERQAAEAMNVLHTARESVKFSERLVLKDLKTSTDLTRDRLSLLKAQRTHADLVESLRVLREHTYPRTIAELEGAALQADRDLERQQALAQTTLRSKKMQVDLAERRLLRQTQQFNWATRMLQQCRILAPHDGQVVYVKKGRDWDDQIVAGMEVRFQQPIIVIPDRTKMEVAVRIHESLRRHLAVGMPAEIRLDADRQTVMAGTVTSVSAFPLSGGWPNRDRREYEVVVQLNEDCLELAPGLTAGVDLIAASKDDALQVPVGAITEIDHRYLVFVHNGTLIEPREVVLGAAAKENIEILDGVKNGERVMLEPRENCPEAVLACEQPRSTPLLAERAELAAE